MLIRVKRLREGVMLPGYATDGAACFDLYAAGDTPYVVHPGCRVVVPTGLAVEVPSGFVMLVYSRSGHGFNHGVRLANSVGLIDSDYRGEIKVALVNDDGKESFVIEAGDRIAQAMLVPIPAVELVEDAELSETARGGGGLGSTGR